MLWRFDVLRLLFCVVGTVLMAMLFLNPFLMVDDRQSERVVERDV